MHPTTHAYSRLLLATEHTEQDRGAETLAFALAVRCGLPLAAVLPILSNPEYEALAPRLAEHAEAQARERIEALAAAAREAGVALQTRARRGPEPFREIVDEAVAAHADLTIVRRRGRRGLLANLLVGDMVRNVVAHAPCDVLVVPRAARLWTQRVLVAIDPATRDLAPVRTAAAVAAESALPLTVVCVAEPAAGTLESTGQALEQAESAARESGVAVDALARVGRAHEQILGAAQQLGADLVVIGRHGSDGLTPPWFGGVAQKVVALADRPVLVSFYGKAGAA